MAIAQQGPLVALIGSGGGHVRQLLDLEPLWRGYRHFFVTEDSGLTRTIAEGHETHFVSHVALGQARLGAPFRMVWNGIRNAAQSLRIMLKRRPDIVITTGAGSCFFAVAVARMLGARIILIDSFARFTAPSVFARIVAPIAHVVIAQSQASATGLKAAHCFDPLRMIEGDSSPKQPQLFATVGATLPFDRLIEAVEQARAEGLVPERIIAQTGIGGRRPVVGEADEVHETIPFSRVEAILRESDLVVCHGGTGSLITALREGCRVIAVPRVFERGEHYDNHQREITDAFRQRGLISVVDEETDFATALAEARARRPVRATTDQSAMIAFLSEKLTDWRAIGRNG